MPNEEMFETWGEISQYAGYSVSHLKRLYTSARKRFGFYFRYRLTSKSRLRATQSEVTDLLKLSGLCANNWRKVA